MSPSRILTSLATAALGVALLSGCGESLTERAVGFGLEQAAEGDEDIDFSFEDNGFRIGTEDGELTLSSDENGGTALFSTEDGEGAITFDQNGVVIDSEDGEDAITFTESGGLAYADENGSSGFYGASEVPANWPAIIGVPATARAGESFFSVFEDVTGTTATGTFQHDPAEPYAQELAARLAADGWVQSVDLSGEASIYSQWDKGTSTVLLVGDASGWTSVSLTIA